jgi:hypothetical protein
MAVDLHHIFLGIGLGGGHKGEEDFVDDLSRFVIADLSIADMMRDKCLRTPPRPEYLLCDPLGIRTGYPHNADATFSIWRGYGGDGVVLISLKHHVYATLSRDKSDVKVQRIFRPKVDGQRLIGSYHLTEHKA